MDKSMVPEMPISNPWLGYRGSAYELSRERVRNRNRNQGVYIGLRAPIRFSSCNVRSQISLAA
jgi:hypothetical protein